MKFIALGAVAVASLLATAAQAETCFKAGEESSGIGKVCYYRCNAGTEAVNVGAASMCPMSVQSGSSGSGRGARLDDSRMGGSLGSSSCFKQGERTTGMSKECIYTCSGTRRVTTVSSAQLCPLRPE
jgi:hypothetical protein